MEEQQGGISVANIGGTAIALIVVFVVITVVSTVVAFMFGMLQYYLSSMRWEAALVLGNIAGGIASPHAARYSCDATIKNYNAKAICVILLALFFAMSLFQLSRGLNQETLFRMALMISMAITTWLVFWKDDY